MGEGLAGVFRARERHPGLLETRGFHPAPRRTRQVASFHPADARAPTCPRQRDPPRTRRVLLAIAVAAAAILARALLGSRRAMSAAAGAPVTAHSFSVTLAPAHGGATVPTSELLGGKVALLVNVASACGLTPQYKGLEKLHQDFKGRGLVVLGFPSNEFGGQEPGTDAEINDFLCSRFQATFPLTTKVHVNGADAHPLWAWMKKEKKELFVEAVKWCAIASRARARGSSSLRLSPPHPPATLAERAGTLRSSSSAATARSSSASRRRRRPRRSPRTSRRRCDTKRDKKAPRHPLPPASPRVRDAPPPPLPPPPPPSYRRVV